MLPLMGGCGRLSGGGDRFCLGDCVTTFLLKREDLMPNLESLIAQQNSILSELLRTFNPQQIGFHDSIGTQYVYANRSQNCLWYTLKRDSKEVVPIEFNSLTGYVEKLEFKQVERRGKETWKVHLHIRADRLYVIESGYDSNFSKSLICALAILTPEQAKSLITVEVQAADQSEEVLFCRVYAAKEYVFAPWDESTDFKTVARRAMAKVNSSQVQPADAERLEVGEVEEF